MFKSLREFTLDKPVNRVKLKIRHTREGHEGTACTIVQLYGTEIVHRVNVNNVVTLNSGGYRTTSTKTAINTALKCIYGREVSRPYVYQSKGIWYVRIPGGVDVKYFDGLILGGGCGAPFVVLN